MHRPSEGSCCCREDGWERSFAWAAPTTRQVTTNPSQTLSLDSTTSTSPASCSPESSPCSPKLRTATIGHLRAKTGQAGIEQFKVECFLSNFNFANKDCN
jgi:hypothetical protein